jgi:hypothetical protein
VAGVRRLRAFPGSQLVGQPLAGGHVSELELLASLGDPTQRSVPADEPVFDWDLAFPCQLVLSARFVQRTETIELRLDAGDIDHGLRHLAATVTDLWRLDETQPAVYAELCGPVDRSWELWRATGNGAREVVASGLTRRDAFCRQAEADARADLAVDAADGAITDRYVAMRTS